MTQVELRSSQSDAGGSSLCRTKNANWAAAEWPRQLYTGFFYKNADSDICCSLL